MAGAGLVREIEGSLPDHLREWWTQDLWCLHSAAWWRRHWERTGIMEIDRADTMPDGWQRWLDWHRAVAPDNEAVSGNEIKLMFEMIRVQGIYVPAGPRASRKRVSLAASPLRAFPYGTIV
jgi:hypothetical protein